MYKITAIFLLAILDFSVISAEETGEIFYSGGRFSAEGTLGADPSLRAHAGGMLKYNLYDHFTIATQTNAGYSVWSFGAHVSIPQNDFSSKSFTASQRFGGGTVLGGGRYSHTILLLAGPQYYRLWESHNYEGLEAGNTEVSSWLFDAGLHYGFKAGVNKTYFTAQVYIPFVRYPDNLLDITLSVGIGHHFRLERREKEEE